MYYEKEVGGSRKEMIAFLKNHYRYYTMNPWNANTSYANIVKIPNLGLLPDIKSGAYDFICAECPEYESAVSDLIDEFRCETAYDVGFNGRSDGYIVLYGTTTDKYGHLRTSTQGIDQDGDFGDWDTDYIENRVNLVCAFDRLCDRIRNTFIYYVTNCKIEEQEYTVTKTCRVAVMKEDDGNGLP